MSYTRIIYKGKFFYNIFKISKKFEKYNLSVLQKRFRLSLNNLHL